MTVLPLVLEKCGKYQPQDIEAFINLGGFKALSKVQSAMSPEEVIEQVKISQLRGRGGAGFPCGIKWELARNTHEPEKFLICNADEGDVGTFKDRFLLQHDPFTLIEGLAIAAYAVGATQAFIYLRAEYHFLHPLLKNAIQQTSTGGFLDELEIQIIEGAGAYICGEESALMHSMEGLRGEPRTKPPYPTIEGLWRKPTIINNVETLMNIPPILLNGGSWFSQIGTSLSKGTKLFSVCGDVQNPGVYELVMGSSLRELLDLAGAEETKMVQVGGASGSILAHSALDTSLAFETHLGSGAVIVFNHSRDVLDMIRRTVEFLAEESCGKCTPCREGLEETLEIFNRLVEGLSRPNDLSVLEELCAVMSSSSACGLGQSAAIPIMDSLGHFRPDYETRVGQSMVIRSVRSLPG
jgi:NADH:ubiquinone oxidoreductase subunit F (NADH-binding)